MRDLVRNCLRPICDAHLPDGSRVNAIVSPLAIGGPALTIRKFRKDKLTPEQFFRYDAARTYHRR
jgi:pilus assembly protein CpaF